MRNVMMVLFVGGLFLGAVTLQAEQPPGLEKKGKVPPGFSKGEKAGWQNEYPPGWDKKNEKEKKEWKDAVKKGRDKVLKAATEKGLSKEEAESAADDFEKGARKGLSPEECESLVKDKIKQGKKGKELSDALAEETGKGHEDKDKKENGKKQKGKGKGRGKKNK